MGVSCLWACRGRGLGASLSAPGPFCTRREGACGDGGGAAPSWARLGCTPAESRVPDLPVGVCRDASCMSFGCKPAGSRGGPAHMIPAGWGARPVRPSQTLK